MNMKGNTEFSISALRTQVRKLPHLPGVYLMKDEAGKVIYVGKAKDLRARVKTYFLGGDGRVQVQFLIRRIRHLETIVTDSENQAFILERDLITKHKPRYNIRLKDDRAYLSIRIDKNAPWPRLELVRKIESDGARYFGPYASSYELRSLLDIVRRVVPLRTCADTVLYNRQRPCLEHQIKRCTAPCCGLVSREEYMEKLKQAIGILEGRTDQIVKELKAEMEAASDDLRFEEAAALRDRIHVLEGAKVNQGLVSSGGENRDVFNLYREDSLAALSVLRVRNGHVSDSANFIFNDVLITDEEVYEGAIEQFYDGGRDIPDEIVLPLALTNASIVSRALTDKRGGGHVVLFVPQKGIRLRLLGLAAVNAKHQFLSVFDAETRAKESAKELAKTLRLKQIPRRIECVDISNLQGSDIVGALVTFYDGQPDKSAYRKYTISFQDKPDDFAAIGEVVRRRLKRAIEEGTQPDLMIIDGGAAQLKKAVEAREEAKAAVELVAIAKNRAEIAAGPKARSEKPERIYIEGAEEPIALDPSKPVTHFVQRIRDEAHRFVISFHRSKRQSRVLKSSLDDISGLGPDRKRRLLIHFGTLKRISSAPAGDVAKVGRMPLALAQKVLEKLAFAVKNAPPP